MRIPFIFAGYGREEDAWAQALNARIIWETKIYEVSRLPGHPLYELLLAGLWPIEHDYWFFNGLSALVSSLTIVTFYYIALKLRLKSPMLLTIVFSFIPAFFIAGTYTIDYNFGLFFVLLSFLQLLHKRYWWAGLLIGIATGIRISHFGFLLPWLIMIWPSSQRWKAIGIVIISASAIATLAYWLPISTYQTEFLDFHKPPFPSWPNIIYKLSFGLWGVPLLMFIGGFVFLHLRKPMSFWLLKDSELKLPKNFPISMLLILGMQLFVFIRLPFKSEFLIPFLPFFILYVGSLMKQNTIAFFALSSLASCFLFGFDYRSEFRGGHASAVALNFKAGGKQLFFDPIKGPAIIDQSKREVKSAMVSKVLNWMDDRQRPTYLIAGWYWPEIELRKDRSSEVKTDYYATAKEFEAAKAQEMEVFYLPEINEANAKINAHYLADSLGKPWKPE